MNLFIKAAVGIYIISVLVFSSFSKADDFENTFNGTDIYSLATAPESVVGMIENLDESFQTSLVNDLAGELFVSGNSLVFVSTDKKTYFRLSPDVLDDFEIEALPQQVSLSGFYNSVTNKSSARNINFLNVEELHFLN